MIDENITHLPEWVSGTECQEILSGLQRCEASTLNTLCPRPEKVYMGEQIETKQGGQVQDPKTFQHEDRTRRHDEEAEEEREGREGITYG